MITRNINPNPDPKHGDPRTRKVETQQGQSVYIVPERFCRVCGWIKRMEFAIHQNHTNPFEPIHEVIEPDQKFAA